MMTFIRQVFSEADGTGSFGRVLSGFIILWAACILSWHVVHNKSLPAGSEVVLYFTAALMPYTVSKAGAAFAQQGK